MFNIMVDNSAMKDKTNCYIKIVCEDYCCDSDEEPIPRIHLVFQFVQKRITIK